MSISTIIKARPFPYRGKAGGRGDGERPWRMRKPTAEGGYVNRGGVAVRAERPTAGNDKEVAFFKKSAAEAKLRTGFHPAAMPGPVWKAGLGWHYPDGEKYFAYVRRFYRFWLPISKVEALPPNSTGGLYSLGVKFRYPSERKRKQPKFMLPKKLVHRLGGMTLRVHVGHDGVANVNLDRAAANGAADQFFNFGLKQGVWLDGANHDFEVAIVDRAEFDRQG